MSACHFTADCTEPAAYRIDWDRDWVDIGGTDACAGHAAEARANDPLEYITAVRSLPTYAERHMPKGWKP